MPPTKKTDLELIQQLKYIDPLGDGTKTPVSGWEVFQQAISYDERQYNAFVASLLASLAEIEDDSERERAVRVLQETLNGVQSARAHARKLRRIPSVVNYPASKGLPSLIDQTNREFERFYRDKITTIGPVVLSQEDTPILDISVSEEYDIELLKTLRGITDPVAKGHRNKVMFTLTIQFPGQTINGAQRADAKPPYPSSLRRLIATLRAAPVVEIESESIVPIFVNSILTPELQDSLRSEVANRVKTAVEDVGQPNTVSNYLEEVFSTTPRDKPIAPPKSPRVSSLPSYTVDSVYDGDTLYLTSEVNGTKSVRLLGINTPEIANVHKGTGNQEGSIEARDYLRSLLPAGTTVRLEFDADPIDEERLYNDDDDRNLCYVYRSSDGLQVNLKMIQEGFAKPMSIKPNTRYEAAFRDAYLATVYPKYSNFKQLLNNSSPIIDFIMSPTPTNRLPVPPSGIQTADNNRRSKTHFSVAAAYAGMVVYTDPEKRNSLIAKISFIKFNDSAFQSGKVLYRDRNGNKTTNVLDCPWIDAIANHMYLGLPSRDGENSVHYMEPYWIPGIGEPLIEFSWTDPYSGETQYYTPDPASVVLTEVRAQATNKIVTLPLTGQVHPVCQFMGAENQVAVLKMTVHDRLELARIHEMKAELDQINYDSSPIEKKAVLKIKNNVLNFVGAREFVISRINTSLDNSKNVYTVEMQLVESRISASEVETITLKTNDKATVRDLKKTWMRIHEILSGESDSWDPAEGNLARDLIFGKNRDGVRTLLLPNALAATYYSIATNFIRGKVDVWDTSFERAPSVVAAVFAFSQNNAGDYGNFVLTGPNQNEKQRAITIGRSEGLYYLTGKTDPVVALFQTPAGPPDFGSQTNTVFGGNDFGPLLTWPTGGNITGTVRDQIEDRGENLIAYLGTTLQLKVKFRRDAWEKYFDVVMFEGLPDANIANPAWTTQDLALARSSILSLAATGLMYNFTSIKNFETLQTTATEEDVILSRNSNEPVKKSNYADINLPTYAHLFANEEVSTSEDGTRKIPLWKRFAPTYDDLGREPPYDLKVALSNSDDIYGLVARGINDQVEPDLPYWHERLKRKAYSEVDPNRGIQAALSYIAQNSVSVSSEEASSLGLTAREYLSQLFNSPSRVTTPDLIDQQDVREKLKKQNLWFTSDGQNLLLTNKSTKGASATTFSLKKAGANAVIAMDSGRSVLDPLSAEDMAKNYRSLVDRYPDKTLSMSKLFPAYRLYFVEEDRETAYLADDLYGSNCVLSIHLRKEKDAPDTLTAQLSNVTDNLGSEAIIPDSVAAKLGLVKDDEGEGYFSRLKLQPGVTIQVRVGYGSKPEDLDIVFTGQITDVTPGKVVTIAAQGHKKELMNEVQFVKESTNYFDIIQSILLKSSTPHLGRTFTVDQLSSKRIQEAIGPSASVANLYSGFSTLTKTASTSATQNVYLEAATEFGSGLFLLGTPGWVVPPQSGWEALKEVTRHFPGHIVDVVPRGVDGTLFIGKPNQPYVADTPHPRETYLYNSLSKRIATTNILGFSNEILAPYLGQTFTDNYRRYKEELLGVNHRLVGATPNRSPDLLLVGGDTGLELAFINSNNTFNVAQSYGKDGIPTHRDYTEDWNFISGIDPEAMKFLIYWFFEVDPVKASKTTLETSWNDIYYLFGSTENKVFKDYLASLRETRVLGTPMSLLRADVSSDITTVATGISIQQRLIRQRVREGVLSQEEGDIAIKALLSNLGKADSAIGVDRNAYGDPATTLAIRGDVPLARLVLSKGGAFKLFIHYLAQDLRARQKNDTGNSAISEARARVAAGNIRQGGLPPGWKVFRNYHRIGSRDIIDNSIFASTSDMANCVLVRAPDSKSFLSGIRHGAGVDVTTKEKDDQETVTVNYEETQWVSFPTNDGLAFNEKIALKNRKLVVVPELNAMDDLQKNRVLMSNMALSLQPMYRGTLTIIGRHVKPHDVIYIDDPEKDLQGHFEVAAVTHHFTSNTGWNTVIEPHALVDVNNPTARIELSAMQQFLDAVEPLMTLLDIGLIVLNIAAVIGSLGTAEPAVAAGSLAVRTGVRGAIDKAAAWASGKLGRSLLGRTGVDAGEAVAKSGFRRNALGMIRAVGGHFARNQARYTYGMLGASFGYRLGRIVTNIQVKNQIGSTLLPISLHPLVYRGQAFEAGLEIEDEDIYTLDDRFESVWSAVKNGTANFFYSTWRNLPLVGRGNLHPMDKFENNK